MTRPTMVVTADDYGLTDATSRSIVEAHETGVVTATSALVVVPGALGRLRWLADVPALSVGVHLALVGEDPPLLTRAEIPTLVDRQGKLRAGWRQLVPLLAARRIDPADVRRELQAQIDAVASVLAPTHLDSHQHLHLWPMVAEVVVELATANEVGAVRVPRPTASTARNRLIDRLSRRLSTRVAEAGLASTEQFIGLDEAGSWTPARLRAAIGALDPRRGSVEVNLHPGARTDADRTRYAWGYQWGSELDACVDPSVRTAIHDAGFDLAGR